MKTLIIIILYSILSLAQTHDVGQSNANVTSALAKALAQSDSNTVYRNAILTKLNKSDSTIYATQTDIEGDISDYTVTEMDSLLTLAGTAKQKSDSTASTGYVTQYDLAQFTGGGGLDNVVEDLTPQLGGNLDLNGKNISNASGTAFTLTPTELSYVDAGTSSFQTQINALEDSIQALNSKFQSILDALTGCCDLSDVTPPSAPTSLVATADNDTAKIRLTWTDPTAGDLDSIRIYRAVIADTSAYTYLTRVAAGVKAYTNTGLTENTAYWYKLKAVDDSSNISGYSNRDSAKTFTAGSSLSGEIFYTDFESGTLGSIFDAVVINSPNTIALATDTVKNGSKSGKWVAGDSGANPDFWTTIVAPDVTKVYISFWIRYNDVTNETATGTQKDYVVTLSDGAGSVAAGVRWIIDSNHLYSLGLRVEGTGETTLPPGIQEDVPFTWQHWEIRYSHGATDYFALKVDGDSVGAISLVNQAGVFIDSIKIGLNLGNEGAENGYWYIDDIEVDSSLTRW